MADQKKNVKRGGRPAVNANGFQSGFLRIETTVDGKVVSARETSATLKEAVKMVGGEMARLGKGNFSITIKPLIAAE